MTNVMYLKGCYLLDASKKGKVVT